MAVSHPESEQMHRLSGPDPFDLARKLRSCLRDASESRAGTGIKYLWLFVSKDGIGNSESTPSRKLSVEQWLNVVDEAAAMGAERLVISAQSDLSAHPEVWEIAHWAQDVHGMMVGLHVFDNPISDSVIGHISRLDMGNFRLFVSSPDYPQAETLEKRGVKVRVATPAAEHPERRCEMPQSMIYVNPNGELYTCGMVDGRQNYRLGSIVDGIFSKIVQDPGLPHAVEPEHQTVSRGCEGCPPLLSKFLYEE